MSLLAAVRRSACRLACGSSHPPSLSVIRATKAVNAAHADAFRAWDNLLARGTPSMGGAESDLCLAQYFYGIATPFLADASGPKASSEEIGVALRRAATDMMDGSTAVLRASARLRGEISGILRDGAKSYVEGATEILRASGSDGDHAAWFIDASARKIVSAGNSFHLAVDKIFDTYTAGSATANWDLFSHINNEVETAYEAKEMVIEVLENFPFEVKEKHNSADLTLTRRYEDEEIEVVVSAPFVAKDMPECNWAESASGNANAEPKSVLALQVTVTKGGSLSIFTCTSSQSEVSVDSVYMRLTVREDDKEEYYLSFEGANSNEMLQQLLHKYLELRGITMMTTSFLHRLLSSKGVFVNMFWLKMLKDFVKQTAGQRK